MKKFFMSLIAVATCAVCSANFTVIEEDFENYRVDGNFASVVKDGDDDFALKVVSDSFEGSKVCFIGLPVDEVAGEKVKFSCEVKGENIVRQKPQHILGGKFTLMLGTPAGTLWPDAYVGYGTFDWKKIQFTTDIPYDAKSADLFVGLQGATGTIFFRDVEIEVIEE